MTECISFPNETNLLGGSFLVLELDQVSFDYPGRML